MSVADARRLLAATLLATMLTGCSVLDNATAPPPRTLQLIPSGDVELAAHGDHGVLLIEAPDARAGYRSTAIAYRRDPLALDYFATAQWAAPPAQLLTDATTDAFAGAGLFDAVITPAAAVPADYRLHLELLYLEQDYRRGGGGVARIAVRARLIRTADNHVAGTRLLSATQKAEAPGPSAAASAASGAASRLLADLVRFVAELLPADRDGDETS